MPKTIFILTGPTASGKSDIAIKISEITGGEIISADSMLIYRRMDIGTEKPPASLREKITHYLVDIKEPWEDYSVGEYIRDFETITTRLYGQNKPFIVVGGTALYLKAIINGLFKGPPADWEYRNYLKAIAKQNGADRLYGMLASVDPKTSDRLHVNDQRRVIRALEVFKQTGRSISSFQKQFGHINPKYHCIVVAIAYDRDILYKRIEDRVDRMFSKGLIYEVQTLINNPRCISKQAYQALGYKEVIDFLNGHCSLSDTIATVKKRTRHFAKRQMTWFRSFSNIYWVPAHEDDNADSLAEKVLEYYSSSGLFSNQ